MTIAARFTSALAVSLLTLALAGCGPDKAGDDDVSQAAGGAATEAAPVETASAAAGDGGGSGGVCPAVAQEGYDLFGSDLVAIAPAEGAVYGDGTPISWTFVDPPNGTLDVDMSYVNDAGDAITMGGIFLDDMGNNEWGSNLNIFDSDADGRPGFMFLGLTDDAGLDADGTVTGNHEVLGVYCVTFKVAP